MAQLVLVAGMSCSGKTTLAHRLTQRLSALHLSMDDYYRGFDSLSLEDRKRVDFDAPEAIEHELLVTQLAALKAGLPVYKPSYSHADYARTGSTLVQADQVIVLEGLFSLYWQELREIADATVYVDTPVSVCLERRLFRDTVEFNRSRDESLHRYLNHVLPNQDKYVLPTREHAKYVVSGEECLDYACGVLSRALAGTFAD